MAHGMLPVHSAGRGAATQLRAAHQRLLDAVRSDVTDMATPEEQAPRPPPGCCSGNSRLISISGSVMLLALPQPLQVKPLRSRPLKLRAVGQ
jgi:hypothetical protein